MKKALYLLPIITIFLCFSLLSPVRAFAEGSGGTSQGYIQDGTFDYTQLYQPVTVTDLSSWTNIFWNAIIWISFGSPLANTFIGKSLSVVAMGGNGVQSMISLFSSLGIFGAFIVVTVILNHFRKLVH